MSTEEKLQKLTLVVEQLVGQIASLGINTNRTPHFVPNEKSPKDKSLRVDVCEFDGATLNPEDYIEWERNLENYFEFKDTPENQKFTFAKVKITRLEATWLEGVQRQRVRDNRAKINSWEKLKKHMKRKYVPPTYKQQLYS